MFYGQLIFLNISLNYFVRSCSKLYSILSLILTYTDGNNNFIQFGIRTPAAVKERESQKLTASTSDILGFYCYILTF